MSAIMAEKKIQENPLPEDKPTEQTEADKQKDMPKPEADKTTTVPIPNSPVVPPSPRLTIPSFTKTSPNDLYRKLLPAVLFLLTFVTVMTMLLIYMDTVALGAQQFRLNMSRDYELARIPQESPPLVAYVRQLHLAPRPLARPPPVPEPTEKVQVLDRILGEIYNGTFIEFLPHGGRDPTTEYLEGARGWEGVVARAAARDYLALRPRARALHACLSPTDHPREVTYHEPESESRSHAFSSRVLCLPLYTVALAAEAARAHYVLVGGESARGGLAHVPYHRVRFDVIELRSTDPTARNKTTEFLSTKNYTVAATFEDAVMYALNEESAINT